MLNFMVVIPSATPLSPAGKVKLKQKMRYCVINHICQLSILFWISLISRRASWTSSWTTERLPPRCRMDPTLVRSVCSPTRAGWPVCAQRPTATYSGNNTNSERIESQNIWPFREMGRIQSFSVESENTLFMYPHLGACLADMFIGNCHEFDISYPAGSLCHSAQLRW